MPCEDLVHLRHQLQQEEPQQEGEGKASQGSEQQEGPQQEDEKKPSQGSGREEEPQQENGAPAISSRPLTSWTGADVNRFFGGKGKPSERSEQQEGPQQEGEEPQQEGKGKTFRWAGIDTGMSEREFFAYKPPKEEGSKPSEGSGQQEGPQAGSPPSSPAEDGFLATLEHVGDRGEATPFASTYDIDREVELLDAGADGVVEELFATDSEQEQTQPALGAAPSVPPPQPVTPPQASPPREDKAAPSPTVVLSPIDKLLQELESTLIETL